MTPKEKFFSWHRDNSIVCTCEKCSFLDSCNRSWDLLAVNGECWAQSNDSADLLYADKQKKRRLYALLEMLAYKKIFYEQFLELEQNYSLFGRESFIELYQWNINKVERWETKLKATAKRWGVVCPNP